MKMIFFHQASLSMLTRLHDSISEIHYSDLDLLLDWTENEYTGLMFHEGWWEDLRFP